MQQNNIIDKNGIIFDSDYKLKIKLESGAGGYVCGEETTLLNTMEGKRREPRLKPPFPTEKGVFSLPTIINNAETLCNVTYILNHSVREYKKIGIKDFPGTKLLSVSGHFKMNGIIEKRLDGLVTVEIYDNFVKLYTNSRVGSPLKIKTNENDELVWQYVIS